VDWDAVIPVPIKFSALALGTKLFDYCRAHHEKEILNSAQEDEFHQELTRLEREHSNSSVLSQFYTESKENFFLELLLSGRNLADLHKYRPKELAAALKRTPQKILDTKREWQDFTRIFFTSQGRPVPSWPAYVEIQQGLGILGRSKYSMMKIGLTDKVQSVLLVVLRRILNMFPRSTWAKGKYCYLQSAGWHKYRLLDGRYSCLGYNEV
jgi:hypothetical protein